MHEGCLEDPKAFCYGCGLPDSECQNPVQSLGVPASDALNCECIATTSSKVTPKNIGSKRSDPSAMTKDNTASKDNTAFTLMGKIIFTDSLRSALAALKSMRRAGLKLKSKFFIKRIRYLGYIIGDAAICTDSDKLHVGPGCLT